MAVRRGYLADLKKQSDKQLFKLYQEMDSVTAFNTLYERHKSKVMGFIYKKVNSKQVAGEIFQDVFLRVHRNRKRYNGSIPFTAWLFIIAKSSIIDSYRRESKHSANSQLKEEIVSRPNDQLEIDLSGLSQEERDLVHSKFFLGKKYSEISSELNKTESSLRKKMSRIFAKIRSFRRGED